MDILAGLNEKQKEAVLHTEGPLLIVAGAGAGKTKTLTHRILYLIEKGVRPEQILAITFTNKAAREMSERVEKLLPSTHARPFVATFHSLGVHILKRHGEAVGIPRHFTIFDKSDSLSAVKEALKENGVDPKLFDPKRVMDTISRQKGECVTAEEYAAAADGYFPKIASEAWQTYESILKKRNALDFDDLLLKTLHLLEKNESIREFYQNLWQYIHIDEYQDTNSVQYEIGKLLADDHKNICVVGDADQNIYSWRGANIKNILNFEKDFSGTRVVLLEENYRSTPIILAAANAVIEKNKVRVPKNLFTSRNGGEKISVFPAHDEADEAEFVAQKTGELLGKSVPAKEIAVLFRANYQSRSLEEAFIAAGIPYQMLGTRFFERKEIKDALSFLRAALNKESALDVKRALSAIPRGIGEKTLERVFAGEKGSLTPAMRARVDEFFALLADIREKILKEKPSLVVKYVLEASGMEEALISGGKNKKSEEDAERLENIHELTSLATKFDGLPAGEGIEKLLEEAALMSDQDTMVPQNSVKLMTVHASKGLEFSYVFITGLEDGLFPHRNMDMSSLGREREEEERRLFYVALTRAKEKLYLTHTSVRAVFGGRQVNLPSEFLSDIPEELSEEEIRLGGENIKTVYME